MKTPQQIIKDTYDNNPKLKEQLDLYGLTLEDVGVQFIQSTQYFSNEKSLTLGYSLKDDEVVSCSVSFIIPETDEVMRE